MYKKTERIKMRIIFILSQIWALILLIIRKIIDWLRAQWRKILNIGIGISIFQIVNKIGLGFINPIIVYIFDIKIAIVVMFLTSVLIRFCLIKLYDSLKIDWLYIEKIKEKQLTGQTILVGSKNHCNTKLIVYLSKFGRFFLIFVLVIYDPFLLVIYQRSGSNTWNNIPNITTLGLFLISCLACTLIALSWTKPLVNFIF